MQIGWSVVHTSGNRVCLSRDPVPTPRQGSTGVNERLKSGDAWFAPWFSRVVLLSCCRNVDITNERCQYPL